MRITESGSTISTPTNEMTSTSREIFHCQSCGWGMADEFFQHYPTGKRFKWCKECFSKSGSPKSDKAKALKPTPNFRSLLIYSQEFVQKHWGRYWEILGTTCNMCQKDLCGLPRREMHVDHDHETGKVRGLLCVRCNFAVGVFERYAMLCESYLSCDRTEHDETLRRGVLFDERHMTPRIQDWFDETYDENAFG